MSISAAAVPGIRLDWVVEEAFAEVPAWHPAVRRVIPIALRRWRRGIRKALLGGEVAEFLRALRLERYDRVVDAQGLLVKELSTARDTKEETIVSELESLFAPPEEAEE